MGSKKPLACRHCGKLFARTAGAGLFCGDDCKAEHESKRESQRGMLMLAGFEQHPETPNIWHKDGVAVTEEQVKHVGFEKAIQWHSRVTAEHTARLSNL